MRFLNPKNQAEYDEIHRKLSDEATSWADKVILTKRKRQMEDSLHNQARAMGEARRNKERGAKQ